MYKDNRHALCIVCQLGVCTVSLALSPDVWNKSRLFSLDTLLLKEEVHTSAESRVRYSRSGDAS